MSSTAAAASTTAVQLATCDDQLPLLGVTREFDFGQFIELFDSSPDPNNPSGPPTVARVVIQTTATLAAERDQSSKPVQSTSSPITAAPASPDDEPQVHLFSLTEHGPAAKVAPLEVSVKDREAFLQTGEIQVGSNTLRLNVDAEMRDAINGGLSVTAFANGQDARDGTGKVLVKLTPEFEKVSLDQQQVYQVLAGGTVRTANGIYKPRLDSGAMESLLQGASVLTHAVGMDGGSAQPIQLEPSGLTVQPLQSSFEVYDLPGFLADPKLPANNGELLTVDVSPNAVAELLRTSRSQVSWNGTAVEMTLVDPSRRTDLEEFAKVKPLLTKASHGGKWPGVKPPGVSWDDMLALADKLKYQPYFVHPLYGKYGYLDHNDGLYQAGTGTTTHKNPSMTDLVQPRLPSGSGLPVAVFVPWRQTWTLTGFSRGNLLHSIALAPQEQVTLQVFSWERRFRSLEQSSETEVEQSTETTQTSRDTEDVFRQMLAKHDFAWQLSGSLDASYNNGVASIQVGVNGQVSDTQSIEQTARTSSQRVRESTIKASGRVRSRRVTRITQTIESGREDRVTRVIRNPNMCHTLTMDFFESLAHYDITLQFLPDGLRLVVLLPNPVQIGDFSSELVRRNETTLRDALLEPALVDGFAACRTVAAYEEAKGLLLTQQAEAAKSKEVTTQRDQTPPANITDPAAPQQAEVVRIVKAMIGAIQQIHGQGSIDAAMNGIRDHKAVTEEVRRRGQYWLFINFAAAKFPAVVTTLDQLSTSSGNDMEAAQKLLAVLPKPDAPTNLGNLNQMSDAEKEASGIASKIKSGYMKNSWDWAWWTGRMREEGLYTSNDAGLGGLADQLGRAYQDWEAKKAQGAAMKDQAVAKTEAEGKQQQASTEDKLAMAFPLDELARAQERQKVLRDHLNEHREFYNYALFQALPPSEQVLRIIEVSNGRLQVGVFEPRAVAMNGARLAVPLTPLAGSNALQSFVSSLKMKLSTAFQNTDGSTPTDKVVLPTPGMNVSTRLGSCSGCEEYVESARKVELKRLEALAAQEQWEAQRRQKRIEEQKNYDDFHDLPPELKLQVNTKALPTP
jgi:hypothetical protein